MSKIITADDIEQYRNTCIEKLIERDITSFERWREFNGAQFKLMQGYLALEARSPRESELVAAHIIPGSEVPVILRMNADSGKIILRTADQVIGGIPSRQDPFGNISYEVHTEPSVRALYEKALSLRFVKLTTTFPL